MEVKVARVQKPNGLHLRVAAEVVRISKKYRSKVMLSCGNCPKANGCSVLDLLLLEARQGARLNIEAEGPDAKDLVNALSQFFEQGGGI